MGRVAASQAHIAFCDLDRHYRQCAGEVRAAVDRVLLSGHYILGKEVDAFEGEFASFCGSSFGIGVGSGTEALHVALLTAGIGPGDEVITVANAGVPTVAAIMLAGASPVFVDIDERSYTIDPALIERAVGPKTKAVIPVHLYGQTADMAPIVETAHRRGLTVIEDACQAHGAIYGDKRAGSIGDIGCFSFYPTKNLGAFGDGGMIVTNDPGYAARARMIREYGQSRRYHHEIRGLNSRLDELQAAILRSLLPHLDRRNARRREIAGLYDGALMSGVIVKPEAVRRSGHVWHLYVISCDKRDLLQEYLKNAGVQTIAHYPLPVYRQKAYGHLDNAACPVTDRCCGSVLSLPLYPELQDDEALKVARAVNEFKG